MKTFLSMARRTAIPGMAALTLACSSVTDSLLEAVDPDLINPSDVQSAAGAIALANGALARFTYITGATNAVESSWLFGGLLADEWSTSSTFVQNDETDQRAIQENNSSITLQLRNLARVRTSANQAIAGLRTFQPARTALIAEMYFARGFAEMQLAQDFCNGIPLSDGSTGEMRFDDPRTVQEVFEVAVASFDSAMTTATGTDAASVLVQRAARVARARALLGLNRLPEAAALVSDIPTSFAYQHTFSLASVGSNTVWAQGISNNRYSVGDSVEGNGRNIRVFNAIPFGSARDPRLPVNDLLRAGQDGQTFVRVTTLYGQLTPIDVVNGIDARMVQAEDALKAGRTSEWLAIHNALRRSPPALGTVQPPAMADLADPGTEAGRRALHFREKAFWTFGRGQRLGDLRRLVRQYGQQPGATFPTGVHYKGGNYGGDMNLPVVTDERNNPRFHGCLDRNA